jgi:transposase
VHHDEGGDGWAGYSEAGISGTRADRSGRAVLRRKLRRSEVGKFFASLEPCLVGIEASGSAHYWARVLSGAGHTVKLMAPQFVKPYVKSNKNDANDAEAICEAVTRPNMRFVPQKSIEQQDLQCLHRVRSRLVLLCYKANTSFVDFSGV